MSEAHAHEPSLVTGGSTGYDQLLDGVIALCIVAFGTALLALVGVASLDATEGSFFGAMSVAVIGVVVVLEVADRTNVVSVFSQRIRGITNGLVLSTLLLTGVSVASGLPLATLLGGVLIVQSVAVIAAGVASRVEVVDTEPDPSAGLLAGVAFAAIGLLLGALFAGAVVGFGPISIAIGLVTAVGLGAVAVVPREDIGSTLPVGLLVGVLGLVVATATIGVGWQYNPDSIDGGFTGGVVVALFVALGSLVSGWAAAKCRAGFGAPGREYGAFLVVYLNALLIVGIMISIVLFVVSQGAAYAFRGVTVGALSLLIFLVPVAALVTEFARTPVGRDSWHKGARTLVRIVPLAATGAVVALLTGLLVAGERLEYAFAYTVLQNRQSEQLETAIAITPELTVGSLVLVAPALVTFVTLFRRYGSLRNVGERTSRISVVRRAVPIAVAGVSVLIALFVSVGPSPAGVPLGGTIGTTVIVLGALGATAMAALPIAGLAGREGPVADRAQASAPLFPVGIFGGVALLAAVLFLQTPAGVTPRIGPIAVVPAAAVVGALVSVGTAGVTSYAGRQTSERPPSSRKTESSLRRRLLGEETTLSLSAVAGFVALLGLHVTVTGAPVGFLGVSVVDGGAVSWPMVMQTYNPLGLEPGGIMPAIVGTVWLVTGATLFAVPLGLGAAVFLTEYAEQGRFTAVVEVATNALWSTPSIVFGLFGAAFIIPRVGGDESLLAGMLVLGFMLLPLVVITSRESIKAVPDQYRDASAALGVSRWETIKSVVLPAAMPGVITGIILGVGRIAGETAPLILVLGSTLNATEAVSVLDGFQFVSEPPFVINDQLVAASASLPTQVWAVIAAGVSGSPQMGWASATILLLVVLTFYAVGITARTYFRRKLNYE